MSVIPRYIVKYYGKDIEYSLKVLINDNSTLKKDTNLEIDIDIGICNC